MSHRCILPIVLLIGACSSEDVPNLAVEDCLIGTWTRPAFSTCQCDAPGFYTTECDHADCVVDDVIVFVDDGSAFTFQARRSPERGSVSIILGCFVTESVWWIDDDGTLIQSFGSTEFAAEPECSDDRFARGATPFNRTPEPLGSLYGSLPFQAECVDVPLP